MLYSSERPLAAVRGTPRPSVKFLLQQLLIPANYFLLLLLVLSQLLKMSRKARWFANALLRQTDDVVRPAAVARGFVFPTHSLILPCCNTACSCSICR